MTRIKICGLSEVEHALASAKAGADFLGMVFASSRRRVSPQKALRIVEIVRSLPDHPMIVGVFVNSPVREVEQIASYCGLDMVQLSGDEDLGYYRETHYPIIKVVHVAQGQTSEQITAGIEIGLSFKLKHEPIFLLDSMSSRAYGGTGRVFDWGLAQEVSARFRVIIAGGLGPENVGQLITEVKPWGVDVSSGVESGGIKDPAKIEAFISTVREAEGQMSKNIKNFKG